jgi:thiamine kinase-like enzyme
MKTTKTRVPQLVTYGLLDYENNFHYCIIEHIHIPPVSQFLSSCSPNDVEKLGIEIRATLKIFQSLNIDRPELSKNVNSDKDSIFVHGDLSSNNVLYDGKNIAVIDFEDWQFTSPCAELPAIIFEMIHEHINMAPQFFDIPFTELKDALYAGIKMHYNQSRFIDKYKNLFN